MRTESSYFMLDSLTCIYEIIMNYLISISTWICGGNATAKLNRYLPWVDYIGPPWGWTNTISTG